MPKVDVTDHDGVKYVRYHCPGCKHDHSVPADRWSFSGDVEKPTLSPSVRHFIPADGKHFPVERTICHYFIREGFIEYCGDCEHNLRNQRVELPEMVEESE